MTGSAHSWTRRMGSQRNVTVYTCDTSDCPAWTVGKTAGWWRSRTSVYCPAHLPVCRRCDAPLRMQGRALADYPGTVRIGSGGMCETCAQAVKRAKLIPEIDEVDPQKVRYIKRKLADWLENPDDRALIIDALGIGGDLD